MPVVLLAVSFLVGLSGSGTDVNVDAFSSPRHHTQRPCRPIATSTSHFAGGGFGVSNSKKKTAKPKKSKSKSAGLLGELEDYSKSNAASQSSSDDDVASPKLDRFGLPIPTEDDIFPPLATEISRIAADDGDSFNRAEVADAIKNHLGVNLNIFDEDGHSNHVEHNGSDSGSGSDSKWSLKLLHKDPPVFRIDNFFTAEECESYMAMADPSKPQHGSDNQPPKAVQINSPTFSSLSISRRTSTTWFCRYDGVPTLLAKARQLLNGVELCQMEEPQIVRYRTGEEFSWHYDEIPSTQLSNGGQRLATLLVYLNDLDESRGGGTVFRDLTPPLNSNTSDSGSKGKKRSKGKSKNFAKAGSANQQLTVRPKTGSALLFFPSYKDGTPDVRTLHKGEVALDTKMIAQLWIHEREYTASVPEGNLQADAMEGVEQEVERLGFS